ncbi:hypothetical protein DFH27DRAFT_526503 [Peziza echinospora]|nr:hypothetical protein DFH27DRAFT_526503 [Peziza echinospora]
MTSPLKCDQTGHFFGYSPELDIGFTCFECLEEFGASGRRPPLGSYAGSSRKRRSHFPPPPPPPQEETISEHDSAGRRRSRPWRCLQLKCRLVVCDNCSNDLVNPEFPSKARERGGAPPPGMVPPVADSENPPRSKTVRSYRRVRGDDQEQDQSAGQVRGEGATPPEGSGETEADEKRISRVLDDGPIGEEQSTSDKTGAGGSDEEVDLTSLRNQISYRRATNAGRNVVYQHRPLTRPSRNASLDTTALTANDTGRGRLVAPAPPPQGKQSGSSPPQSAPAGPPPARKVQVPVLEVASDADDMDELEFLPKLPVRSASQAASQVLRNSQAQARWNNLGGGGGRLI